MQEHRHHKLVAAKRFAFKQYGKYPNVIGVGIGTKFKRMSRHRNSAERLANTTCIQFFVSRKKRTVSQHHKLPRFVYGRFADGRVNFREKIPTDVIELGKIRAACTAGSQLDSNTEHGLITLIFKNKADLVEPLFLISCAHVAGDIHISPPAYDELTSDCFPANPFAHTIANTTAIQDEIMYDIALAGISASAPPIQELTIRGADYSLTGFLPVESIQQGMWVDAVLRNVNSRGNVDALHATASIQYGPQVFQVHNLFGVNVTAQKGDSGGLVHQNGDAVGIVVAASPAGWLWFQPLKPAFEYLQTISPINISVF